MTQPTCILSNQHNPFGNLAAEELLLQMVQPNEIMLYLWQNENTIVIGRNQDAWREVKVDAFQATGGKLARRLSGGGAVYHDLGNLNFTFLAKKEQYNPEKNLQVLQTAAQSFGIPIQKSGRNDILAQGRKFSGNAFYHTKHSSYHHGTILVCSDIKRLSRYLQPRPEKLAGKGVASVSARVINLNQLSPGLTVERMAQAMQQAMRQVFGGSLRVSSLEQTLPEKQWQALTQKYSSSQWRFGTPLPYTVCWEGKTPFGCLELRLLVVQGRVEQARLYTDGMDPFWPPLIEACLAGCEYSPAAFSSALQPVLASHPAPTSALLAALETELLANKEPEISENQPGKTPSPNL